MRDQERLFQKHANHLIASIERNSVKVKRMKLQSRLASHVQLLHLGCHIGDTFRGIVQPSGDQYLQPVGV